MPLPPHVLRAAVPILDDRACGALGMKLAAAREARGLSIDQVCAVLLLSRRQVRALERLDPEAFYNSAFRLGALRKYVAYLGLPADLLDDVQVEPPAPDDQLPARPEHGLAMRLRWALFGA